jgi:hypothetical protein
MRLQDIPIDNLKKEHIEQLIEDAIRENRFLEYKREYDFKSSDIEKRKDQKTEFLRDITAFANAGGGDLIIGISENNHTPTKPYDPIDKIDTYIKELENLYTRIEPKFISKPIMKPIEVEGGKILLIRIRKSIAAPHRVIKENDYQFYTRVEKSKTTMDINEIREAFLRNSNVLEKAENFVRNRIDLVARGEKHHVKPPAVFFYVIPISTQPFQIDVKDKRIKDNLDKIAWGNSIQFNIDGLIIQNKSNPMQLFRDGKIEQILTGSDLFYEWYKYNCFFLPEFDNFVKWKLEMIIEFYKRFDIQPPFVFFLGIIGAKEYKYANAQNPSEYWTDQAFSRKETFGSDLEIISSNIIDEFIPAEKMLKDVLDTLYQGFGEPFCISYDKDGNWIQR